MKRRIRKALILTTATCVVAVALLFIIILQPCLLYAKSTKIGHCTIFHKQQLDRRFCMSVTEAEKLVATSEFYNSTLQLDICLNDGSAYPTLIRWMRGPAFAWGFYDKVVIQGKTKYEQHYVELRGYKWNTIQLLAHEMTHCLQFDRLGLWKSNPVANIPAWKWQGYAEYIARQGAGQTDLTKNIERLMAAPKDSWEVVFEDGTIAPRRYYEGWLLVQYCLKTKKITYQQLLEDSASEEQVRQQMLGWYNKH